PLAPGRQPGRHPRSLLPRQGRVPDGRGRRAERANKKHDKGRRSRPAPGRPGLPGQAAPSPAGALAGTAGRGGRGPGGAAAGAGRRRDKYAQARALHARGATVAAIARTVGIGRRTVYRYLRSPPPERKRRSDYGQRRVITPFEPYLRTRWAESCRTATVLWR